MLKHSLNQLQKLLKLQLKNWRKTVVLGQKKLLEETEKTKKPLQLPKDFEDISERYTKINQAYEQEKYRNKRPIEEELKKSFLTKPFLCKVVNKLNTPDEKNQIDLELDLTAQDSYSSVIDNEN